MMWKDEDEDVRAQLLLSISGNAEPPEYSCDIFMTFQFLAAHDDESVFANYTTLALTFIKDEGDLISAKRKGPVLSCYKGFVLV